jgi:dTDP-4-dehydrorhamnose reductase
MKENPSVRVVNDQIGSPTYAGDLAEAIMSILESGHFIPGILHYCNEGQASWFTFATAIKELSGISCDVVPILSSGFPTPAKRPSFSLMNTSKIKKLYSLNIPEWKASLAFCINKINQGV